jgi:hypothetical protein
MSLTSYRSAPPRVGATSLQRRLWPMALQQPCRSEALARGRLRVKRPVAKHRADAPSHPAHPGGDSSNRDGRARARCDPYCADLACFLGPPTVPDEKRSRPPKTGGGSLRYGRNFGRRFSGAAEQLPVVHWNYLASRTGFEPVLPT